MYRALLLFCILLGTMPVSCSPAHHIVVDGTAKRLPAPETRVAVWGLRPVVTSAVAEWLRARGYTVIEPVELQRLFDKQNVPVTRSFADEQQALRAAKELQAGLVIMTQSELGSTVVDRDATTTAAVPYPGTVRTTLSNASVAVRGLDVASGELILTGTAKYPQQLAAAGPDTLAMLACQALETAWGLQLPGEQELSPDEAC